jgi:DNA-binding IclR family transcriptional regulator
MRDRLNVVYIDTCRPEHDNSANPDIGSTRPLLATALGRALLLGGPQGEREPALNRLRLDNPTTFAIDVKFWETDQKLFAKRGYCQSNGDWRKDIHAVAVPVRQPLHEEGLALNCTIVSHRLKKDLLEREVAPLLLETTLEIERACGMQ